MVTMYKPYKVNVSTDQTNKLKEAITSQSKAVSLKFSKEDIQKPADHTLLLTNRQIAKLQKAQTAGKASRIILSRKQIITNDRHEGGFLGRLAGLASKILPVLLGGIATGVISGGIEKAIKGGRGSGFFLHKKNHCYKVTPTRGNGLYLSPRPRFTGILGDGLFVKRGKEIVDARGLLLGANSPFKNIPLLNLIL